MFKTARGAQKSLLGHQRKAGCHLGSLVLQQDFIEPVSSLNRVYPGADDPRFVPPHVPSPMAVADQFQVPDDR